MILANTVVEFRCLINYLHGLKQAIQIGLSQVTIEPESNQLPAYGRYFAELITSMTLPRIRKAMHNALDKNYAKDAHVLLHLLSKRFTQQFHDPLIKQTHHFQELPLTYAQVSLAKTRTQHRLLTHYPAALLP